MRILATMVAKNEANRYLDACLYWLGTCVDAVHVYDDQSDDETAEIVLSHDFRLTVRPDDVPTFLEHEGKFRQAAWEAFEKKLEPEEGDWVLALDADEFVVADGKERLAIIEEIHQAERMDEQARILRFAEIFAVTNGVPQIRRDGYWDSIAQARLFQWQPGGQLDQRLLGGGSAPTFVAPYRKSVSRNLTILHYGYASDEDKKVKHHRYRTVPGHNPSLVESILKPAALVPWQGKVPWTSPSL